MNNEFQATGLSRRKFLIGAAAAGAAASLGAVVGCTAGSEPESEATAEGSWDASYDAVVVLSLIHILNASDEQKLPEGRTERKQQARNNKRGSTYDHDETGSAAIGQRTEVKPHDHGNE